MTNTTDEPIDPVGVADDEEQAISQPSPYGNKTDEGEVHNQDHAASDPEED